MYNDKSVDLSLMTSLESERGRRAAYAKRPPQTPPGQFIILFIAELGLCQNVCLTSCLALCI